MQLDPGDTWFNNYLIEHAYRLWMGQLSWDDFWSANFFFPMSNAMAYSDVLISTAPLYAPFRWLGLLPDTAFQMWMIVVMALNYFAAFGFLTKGLRFSKIAATFGAFLFAFGAPRLSQLGHQQLLPHFFTIFGLWMLVDSFRESLKPNASTRFIVTRLGLFWLSVVGQFYTGFYLAWMYFTMLEFFVIAALVFSQSRKQVWVFLKAAWLPFILGAISAGLILWPLMSHYLEVTREVGYRSFEEAKWMIPTLQSWIYQGDRAWIHGWMSQVKLFKIISMGHEHHMGIGLVSSIAIAWVLFKKRKDVWVRPMLLAMILFYVLLTQLPGGYTLWVWGFQYVPGANAVRAISRVCLMYLVPLSIGLAFATEFWVSRLQQRKSIFLSVAILLFFILEQGQTTDAYDKAEPRGRVERITQALQTADKNGETSGRCGYFYYSRESPEGKDWWPWVSQIATMWAARDLNIPTINGYSGNFPQNWYPHFFYNGMTGEEDFKKQQAGLVEWMRFRNLDPAKLCWIKTR